MSITQKKLQVSITNKPSSHKQLKQTYPNQSPVLGTEYDYRQSVLLSRSTPNNLVILPSSGSLHDMSKQPGYSQMPQGQGLPGTYPQYVYQQQPRQYYAPRQARPPTQQMTAQLPQQTIRMAQPYYNPIQPVFINSGQTQMAGPMMQNQVLQPAPLQMTPRPQYHTQPQYINQQATFNPVPATTPPYPTTPNMTQMNNPTVWYNNSGQATTQTQQRPPSNGGMQMQPQQQVQAAPNYQKRERKGIAIIDPYSGKDVLLSEPDTEHKEETGSKSNTPTTSENSSARDTPVATIIPPPSAHSEVNIAAEFAAKVAATLSKPPHSELNEPSGDSSEVHAKHIETTSTSTPPQTKTTELPVQKLHTESLNVKKSSESVTAVVVDDDKKVETEKDSGDETVTEPRTVIPETQSDVSSVNTSVQNVTETKTLAQPDDSNSKGTTETRTSQSFETKEQTVGIENTMNTARPKDTVQEHIVEVSKVEKETVEKEKLADVLKEVLVPSVPAKETDDVLKTETEEEVNLVVKPEEEKSVNVTKAEDEKEKVVIKAETEKTVSVVKTEEFVDSSVKNETDDKANLSKKQKLKELNMKDDMGTDMDGFIEKSQPPNGEATMEELQVDKNKQLKNDNVLDLDNVTTVVSTTTTTVPMTTTPPVTTQVSIATTDVITTPVAKPSAEESEVKQVEINIVPGTPQQNVVEKENDKNNEMSTEQKEKEKKKLLQYSYKEDQWSPLNPEGKMQYDRSFLLQLQYSKDSVVKPASLPKLPDVILDKPREPSEKKDFKVPIFQGNVDFTPGYIRSPRGASENRMRGGGRRSNQGGSRGQSREQRVITLPIKQEVQLHQTENAWKTKNKLDKPEDPEETKTQDLLRAVRGILNKLTPQKFQTLVQQVYDLKIDSELRLNGVINLIFEKAIDEPSFSVAYANMCKCLMMIKVPLGDKPNEFVNFRKLLLIRCQREFERDVAEQDAMLERSKEIEDADTEEKKTLIKLEIEEAEMKSKRRTIGNIRFIGELFKLKMLTENIMHDCLFKLLKAQDEDSLECLCRLLTTIGKDIDTTKAKQRVDQYFHRMETIIKSKKTSSRVKFMIQDVIELRKNAWVPRREDNNPKTIQQIHEEAANEAREKQMFSASHQGHQGHQKPRGPPRGRGSQHQTADDGWTPVVKTSSRIDPSKMKISQHNIDENIQLGPGGKPGFAGWGRGSSGGGMKVSQEADRPSTPGNRYAALQQPDGDRGRMGRGNLGRDRTRVPTPTGQARSEATRRSSEDRAAAVNAVKNLTKPRSRESSRDVKRDSSNDNRKPSVIPNITGDSSSGKSTPTKQLNEDEMERKTKSIIDEYLHIQDLKEARLCVSELQSSSTIHLFVTTALNHVLERSDKARHQTGTLLHDCVKQGIINVDSYLKGLKEVLGYAEDMEIDIPKVWKYLGELIGPVVQDGIVPLSTLKDACEQIIASGKAGLLLSEALHDASHQVGHIKVGDVWKASGLKWAEFLPNGADTKEFIEKYKLEFTVDGDHHAHTAMPMDTIATNLDRLILKEKANNEAIFDWIEENVKENLTKESQFIRALMTCVCKGAISDDDQKVDEKEIIKYSLLLQKYLDGKQEYELQALYALQALVTRLDHPPKMLQRFFDTLYDEDIVSEDAFNNWDSSNDPAEQEGKGVARNSVVQFFTWLREAEDEVEES